MVRNSSVPKMEQTFYEDVAIGQKDLNSLKRTMTLDLNNRGGKKIKLNSETASTALLSSPDLVMLKLGSPELEKLIMDQQSGLVTATPTPTNIFFPTREVTQEQESYARGFMEALHELHHSDSSQGGTQNETIRGGSYASLDQYSNYGCFGTSPESIVIKDEPQTVPNINSPPMSPIDMECQEKIKLERKRQRNRLAASKCRRRKLERIALLEDKVKNLKGENSELSQHVNRLKQQVYELKQQVMEHAKSGCLISVMPTHL